MRKAVIPVLGVGVGKRYSPAGTSKWRCYNRKTSAMWCPHTLVLVEDEDRGDWVLDDTSHLEHNHGPKPQILANPDWRPPVRTDLQAMKKSSRRGRDRASSVSFEARRTLPSGAVS